MNSIEYVKGSLSYLPQVKKLLQLSALPFEDIDAHISDFILALNDGVVIGSVGIETCQQLGLFRSLAVAEQYRGSGIGSELLNRMLDYAKNARLSVLYLLTTTARDYFCNAGFCVISRDDVPEAIKKTREFGSICPVSAVCMCREW